MKVLLLGGSDFLRRAIAGRLAVEGSIELVTASKSSQDPPLALKNVVVDALDQAGLTRALEGTDAVVNCFTGDARSITLGAETLVRAAADSGMPRVVHFSSMGVYGGAEGRIDEQHPIPDGLGWYGQAKMQAEASIERYRQAGGDAVILRPGCMAGSGAIDWVGRPARLLELGRLGDLGVAGDGPSNLVNVTDVASAVAGALTFPMPSGGVPKFNLAAPDSPRWNGYFVDLALALGITPVKRLSARQLKRDVYLRGVALKVAERVTGKLKLRVDLPPAIPPSLMRLWSQQIRLDGSAATRDLALTWTPYAETLAQSANWWRESR